MNMSVQDFLTRLFLLACGGFAAVVFACLVTGCIRSFLERRGKVQCRICGYRFYATPDNSHAECPHCGAHLDSGEKCDCRTAEADDNAEKELKEMAKDNDRN